MKYLILLLSFSCFAQVGIGTTTPDPNSVMHATNPSGLSTPLIFEGIPNTPTVNTISTYDPVTGVFGWRNLPTSGGGLIISVINISEWRNTPLDINVTTTTYLDDAIDLNLTRTITVSPNTTQIVSIEYSVPIGLVAATGVPRTTVGAYILKDGVKLQNSESSFSVRDVGDHAQADKYFPDWITNNTSAPITVTYELMGYLNQETISFSATADYRFKRFDADDALNKNWGTADMHIRILVAQ